MDMHDCQLYSSMVLYSYKRLPWNKRVPNKVALYCGKLPIFNHIMEFSSVAVEFLSRYVNDTYGVTLEYEAFYMAVSMHF